MSDSVGQAAATYVELLCLLWSLYFQPPHFSVLFHYCHFLLPLLLFNGPLSLCVWSFRWLCFHGSCHHALLRFSTTSLSLLLSQLLSTHIWITWHGNWLVSLSSSVWDFVLCDKMDDKHLTVTSFTCFSLQSSVNWEAAHSQYSWIFSYLLWTFSSH